MDGRDDASSVYADRLESLHEATRRLIEAQHEERVAGVAVDAAAEVLQFPYSIYWAADRSAGTLTARATSEAVDEHATECASMVHDEDDYLWEYFEREEPSRVEVTPEKAAAPVPAHSSIVVPLGDQGLLSIGATDRTGIEDGEMRLAAVLGKNVQAALSRAEREGRLAEQRDGLKLLNSIVRHDIRNDLQIVQAAVERLDGADPADEEAVEMIRDRAASAVELTRTARELAEAMLQTEAEPEATSLRPPLRGAVEEVEGAYARGTVAIEGSLPDVRVSGDEMLNSVFRNVIENGIEHNDGDPHVRVAATEDEDRVVVSVTDDGPGIPQEVADEVFERAAKGLDSDGTGIGLYLVATLVDRYGGDVRVAETGPEGTTIEISLPRA